MVLIGYGWLLHGMEQWHKMISLCCNCASFTATMKAALVYYPKTLCLAAMKAALMYYPKTLCLAACDLIE